MLTFEIGGEDMGGLVAHIERRENLGIEPGILVQCSGFDAVVVDADSFVGVTNGDVESEIVVERVVGVVELGEVGIGDVEFDLVGSEYEPEHEDGDAQDDDDGADEFEDEVEDAAEDTATATAAAVAAADWAVVGFGWGDGGAVVGAVQLGLLPSHWMMMEGGK